MKQLHATKDGKEILISDIDDQHLLNTIALIQRKAEEGIVVRRGSDTFYDEDHLYGRDARDELNYQAYVNEAIKRGHNVI